jgi:hypothetical protein
MTGDFGVDIFYTDWSGEQPMRARFLIGRANPTSMWVVYRSQYFDGETGEQVTEAVAVPWEVVPPGDGMPT